MDDDTPVGEDSAPRERWRAALAGARAGRGFRYQDSAAAAFAVVGHVAGEGWSITPEGEEDITLVPRVSEVLQLQVRSRRGQRTAVTRSELGRWLAETWRRHADKMHDPGTRVGIVVDREVEGCAASGFVSALDEAGASIREHLDGLVCPADVSTDDLLARSHLFVSEEPVVFGTRLLASHLGVPQVAAEVVFRQVLARVGALADERGDGAGPAPALTATELPRVIDDALTLVDLASLEEPIRTGFCEHVDFTTPVIDSAFYLGVDVVPGHIAAGLVIDRPDEVGATLDCMGRARVALVAGPSGVGKTAVALLAAHRIRDTVRWVRVRRMGAAFELVRYAEALGAGAYAPVGLIVDDIGRLGAGLWDALAREARHRPGVLLLGTTREEDLDLLEEAPESVVVRPRLSAELGEALWAHLVSQGDSFAAGWREAFEDSESLTLEFVHMLTTGQRLPDVIAEQVERRRREGRDDELHLIRVAAFSAARGASLDLRLFQATSGLSDGDLQRALARLLDEHLLRRLSGERIGGVHRLRSLALTEAAHRLPPPSSAETAAEALRAVPVEELAELAAGIVADGVLTEEGAVFAALASRLAAQPTATTLASCLDGLRLAGIRSFASAAQTVLDRHGVPLAMRRAAASLGLVTQGEVPGVFDDRVRRAVEDFRRLPTPDMRARWLKYIDEALVGAALSATTTVGTAAQSLAAFQGLGADAPTRALAGLSATIQDSTGLRELAKLIDAGRLVDPALAADFVAAAGGADTLLAEAAESVPWVTELQLVEEERPNDESSPGQERVVRFRYLAVGHDDESDVHEVVVELCRFFLALFPDADAVAGTAIDAAGAPLGFHGHLVADKRIPRRDVPSPAEVLWNRMLLNAFADPGPAGRTALVAAEADLLRRANEVAMRAGAAWVRRESPSGVIISDLEHVASAAQQVWKREHLPTDPSAVGTWQPDVGDLADVCRLLCGNAIPRLFARPDMALASFLMDTIHPAFTRLTGISYWRLIDEDLDEEVSALAALVADLHQLLGARLSGDEPSGAMRRAQRARSPVAAAASVAMRESTVDLSRRLERCSRRFARMGAAATVVRLPSKHPAGLLWPEADIVFLLEFDSIFDWLRLADEATSVVEGSFEPTRSVVLAPCRAGCAVLGFALRVLAGAAGVPFPAPADADRAAAVQGLSTFNAKAVEVLGRILEEVAVGTALDRLSASRPLLPVEASRLDAANTAATISIEELLELIADDGSDVLRESASAVLQSIGDTDIADGLSRIARGEADEALGALALFQAAATELQLDAAGAPDRLQRFIEETSEGGQARG